MRVKKILFTFDLKNFKKIGNFLYILWRKINSVSSSLIKLENDERHMRLLNYNIFFHLISRREQIKLTI